MKEQISKEILNNHKQALRIINAAQKEGWPCSRTFSELKLLHLNRYQVNTVTGDTAFFWHDGTETFLKDESKPNRSLGKEYDANKISDAIQKSRKKLVDRPKFLELISAAGCNCYEVNFQTDQIIYYGINENNKVIENITVK